MLKRILLGLILVAIIALGLVAEQSYFTDQFLDEMQGRYANAQSAWVEVDGMQVHYRDTGFSAKPPLLLLHGNSSSLHTWDGWAAQFERTRRVVRLDLPGFGLTGPDPKKRYQFKDLTGFLARFCDAVGLARVDLAGNSHGGRLAWAFAAAMPERVRKLVLVDAAGYPLDAKAKLVAQLRSLWPLSILAQFLTPRFIVDFAVRATYGDKTKVTPALVDHYFGLQLRAGNRLALGEMLSIYGVDDRAAIKAVTGPTLILWGKQDEVIPVADAERFHHDIAGSRVIVYDGIGHLPMEEAPGRSAGDVESFLDGGVARVTANFGASGGASIPAVVPLAAGASRRAVMPPAGRATQRTLVPLAEGTTVPAMPGPPEAPQSRAAHPPTRCTSNPTATTSRSK